MEQSELSSSSEWISQNQKELIRRGSYHPPSCFFLFHASPFSYIFPPGGPVGLRWWQPASLALYLNPTVCCCLDNYDSEKSSTIYPDIYRGHLINNYCWTFALFFCIFLKNLKWSQTCSEWHTPKIFFKMQLKILRSFNIACRGKRREQKEKRYMLYIIIYYNYIYISNISNIIIY